jgi:hypothetical protein
VDLVPPVVYPGHHLDSSGGQLVSIQGELFFCGPALLRLFQPKGGAFKLDDGVEPILGYELVGILGQEAELLLDAVQVRGGRLVCAGVWCRTGLETRSGPVGLVRKSFFSYAQLLLNRLVLEGLGLACCISSTLKILA